MRLLTTHRRSITLALLLVVLSGWYFWRRTSVVNLEQIRSSANALTESEHTQFLIANSTEDPTIQRQLDKLDPSRDGWDSEVVNSVLNDQLKKIRRRVESTKWELKEFASTAFEGDLLSRDTLEAAYRDNVVSVDRLSSNRKGVTRTASFTEAIQGLCLDRPDEITRCTFKIVDIQLDGQQAETRVLIEMFWRNGDTVRQSNATCRLGWDLSDFRSSSGASQPKVSAIEVLQFNNVRLAAGGSSLFDDVTSSVLAGTDCYEPQVLRGIGDWSERLTGLNDMQIYGHHGLSIGDVNGDQLEDLYVCDSGGLPNRLYLQQRDGTIRDASRESKADWLESSTGALLIDLDNDGDQDLMVTTVAGLLIASNDGRGVFRIRFAQAGLPEAHTMCAADYDNDGDLDVYVPSYGAGGAPGGQRGFEAALPIPYYDAHNGGRNVLFENQGDFKFVDVTDRRGLQQNNQRWSFAASWDDFDNDGDMDLYVANDFGRNNLYRNENGSFQDVASDFGVEDRAGGMSVSWGDFNCDGHSDLYIGNMFSAAGKRVTYQRQFLQSHSASDASGLQRMARGNTLFMARPSGPFADVSQSAGVTMGRWAWSSKFADLNNDGWEDLVVANGFFTNERTDDL